jgi:hypothetical protein
MIKANELRIGNWVMFSLLNNPPPDFINKLAKVDAQDIRYIQEDVHSDYMEWNPIPLSPEILEKAGGIKQTHDESEYWFKKDFGLRYLDYAPAIILIIGYERKHVNLKYLHQLQNLFYSLTGEELNIEL